MKNANAIVQPNQIVNVRVMSVDASTGRIALSMKGMSGGPAHEGWIRKHFANTVHYTLMDTSHNTGAHANL